MDRACEIEGTLDWMRSQGVASVEDDPNFAFVKCGDVAKPGDGQFWTHNKG
jgi:hypothetical protein